ncbi:MAG: hypothetical protein ACYDHU_08590 [Acidimicrobiales bacterium]
MRTHATRRKAGGAGAVTVVTDEPVLITTATQHDVVPSRAVTSATFPVPVTPADTLLPPGAGTRTPSRT